MEINLSDFCASIAALRLSYATSVFRSRLPREVVDAPSLETSKARLDQALGNLIELCMSLFIAGELEQMTFKGPSNSKDSVILLLT